MTNYLVVYDATKRFPYAKRLGCRRVVAAMDAEAALATTRDHEAGWTLINVEVRVARPVEIDRQHLIEHWLTLCKSGKAGRWMGL